MSGRRRHGCGSSRGLGASPESHREHARQGGREFKEGMKNLQLSVRRGKCKEAVNALSQLHVAYGQILAARGAMEGHPGRFMRQKKALERMLRKATNATHFTCICSKPLEPWVPQSKGRDR